MTALRQDPLTGRWVIFARNRRLRPNEFRLEAVTTAAADTCPFCPGREDQTTAEVLATGRPAGAEPDSPGWRVRVFPNKYPALVPGAVAAAVSPGSGPGLLHEVPGAGSHEVIVCTPDHTGTLASLDPGQLAELFSVLRLRVAALAADPRHRYVLPFFNQGAAAGATLVHPHGQIIATPLVPDLVSLKQQRIARHRDRTGRCLLCDLQGEERAAGVRVAAANAAWTALAPWASRFACELLILPLRHQASLAELRADECSLLGSLLAEVLAALDRLYPRTPLNLVLHGAPAGARDFHWHLELLPRLARWAGFEAGTGFAINSLWPEEAARRLGEKGLCS